MKELMSEIKDLFTNLHFDARIIRKKIQFDVTAFAWCHHITDKVTLPMELE